jgi:IS5 family transposase
MEKLISKQTNFFETEVDLLVRKDHPYRMILELVDFRGLTKDLKNILNQKHGRPGYNIESGFKGLILQFMEDLSDRELERYLQENNAGKLFCDFKLMEKTPDHSYFCELRRKIGTERLADLFNKFGGKLREKGLVSNIFTFVDASKMISKISLWDERDKAIAEGEEKLNNQNIEKYSADKDADYGCKGNKDFWYGYKRHVAVCMKHGLITKTTTTKASITDAKGLKYICPKGGMIVADKAYCVKPAQDIIKGNGCHSGAILKENMIGKNKDKDRFLTRLRMPYEGIFSKMNKKVRYRGLVKVQFQTFMQGFAYNLKRLIKIGAPPLNFA